MHKNTLVCDSKISTQRFGNNCGWLDFSNLTPSILVIWIWSPVDACWVRRLQNLTNLTGVTHKVWKMCIKVSLLYLAVLDTNPKRFAGYCAWFKNLQNCSLINWALQILNSSFCSLHVFESWLVSTWVMSKTFLRHKYLILDMFLYSFCQRTINLELKHLMLNI